MKILIVNKFYYPRGGDCTAVFGLEQLLKDKGHEVAIFSMQKSENTPSRWEKYFPKEVNFSFSFSLTSLFSSISRILSAVGRLFYSPETVRKFKRLLADFQPDIVHLHNIHSYLSPIVAQIAHQKRIRVVWTLHDYKLICPNYTCLRNGKNCEICFHKKFNVVRHKCMKNSHIASVLAYLEARWWNRKKLSRLTKTFITPSRFMKTKMTDAGFSAAKIEVLPNFMPGKYACSAEKEDYYCYTGRISEEKGLDTLLEAARQLPYHLKIIGEGPMLEKYRERYMSRQIEFCGYMPQDKLYEVVQKALFLVIPSVWYENNPFSVIEALSLGTPVLGAQTGGIPELITEGVNGYLFTPGDHVALRDTIHALFTADKNKFDYKNITSAAYNKFSPDTFYSKLINIYSHF